MVVHSKGSIIGCLAMVLFSTVFPVRGGNKSFNLPELTIFSNDTKEFSMRVSRYVCIETPYQRSHLNYCRSQLRRNQPTLFNISVHVPERLDYMYIQVKTYYKYNTFQTFPVEVIVEVCSFLRNPSSDVISRHVLSVLIELMPAYAHHCPHGVSIIKLCS